MDPLLWTPVRTLLKASLKQAEEQTALTLAALGLGGVAAGLLTAAGLVLLSRGLGFPLAATAFAAGFALLALAVLGLGRQRAAREQRRIDAAGLQAVTDLAVVTGAARSAAPLLPLAALVAAWLVSRRR